MKRKLIIAVIFLTGIKMQSQCVNNLANIYSFTINNTPYEIIKENQSWVNAAACAVSRGGKLAEINSLAEQNGVFAQLNQAGINGANTIAPDGGNGSYVWLGGIDIASEGYWFWDGGNMGSFNQFWMGNASGSAVNGSYTNWGNEPDDWNGQDGLGMAFTNWPLGVAGQWNDVDENNQLYYIIEYPIMISTSLSELKTTNFSIYPNPVDDYISVNTFGTIQEAYKIINQSGRVVIEGELNTNETIIQLNQLQTGLYIIILGRENYRFLKK